MTKILGYLHHVDSLFRRRGRSGRGHPTLVVTNNESTGIPFIPNPEPLEQQFNALLTNLSKLEEPEGNPKYNREHMINVVIPTLRHLQDIVFGANGSEEKGDVRLLTSIDDNAVHDPLGAGSYLYQYPSDFLASILNNAGALTPMGKPKTIIIHIGAQPNNSPHAGTIVTFTLAFLVARNLKRQYEAAFREANLGSTNVDPLEVEISLDLVDTAPDSSQTEFKDGVVYQRSHRSTSAMDQFVPDYDELLKKLSDFIGGEVSVKKTYQVDLLSQPTIPQVLDAITRDHARLGKELSPSKGKLALRSACPKLDCPCLSTDCPCPRSDRPCPDSDCPCLKLDCPPPKSVCGRADKHGIKTEFIIDNHSSDSGPATSPDRLKESGTQINFHCHKHGLYTCSLTSPEDVKTLEFNTPLRNLVRTLVNGLETTSNPERLHMRITGADYSGQYQEQMLYRQLLTLPIAKRSPPPVIIYAPLIVDWSGAKLSKSLYVKDGAYKYLEGQDMDYLLSYQRMKEMGKDVLVLAREVESWVESPKKLFRQHSIVYLHRVFEKARAEAAS